MNEELKRLYAEVPERVERCSNLLIGAAIEVHRRLGPGFLEKTYEEALAIELEHRRIAFERQVSIPVSYREQPITECVLDLLIEGELVVELKAVDKILDLHRAQVLAYLQAGAFELGLLLNFNVPRLKDGISRVILTPRHPYQ